MSSETPCIFLLYYNDVHFSYNHENKQFRRSVGEAFPPPAGMLRSVLRLLSTFRDNISGLILLDFLTTDVGTDTLPHNVDSRLQTYKTQHSRRTKASIRFGNVEVLVSFYFYGSLRR